MRNDPSSASTKNADPDAEKIWLEEAERRLTELKSGKVAGIPAEKVIGKARSAIR